MSRAKSSHAVTSLAGWSHGTSRAMNRAASRGVPNRATNRATSRRPLPHPRARSPGATRRASRPSRAMSPRCGVASRERSD